jgi:hypothetical protein
VDLHTAALALYVHTARMGPDSVERRVWRALAYACRYGHQPLAEMLHLGTYQLAMLTEALSGIVQEENGAKGGG